MNWVGRCHVSDDLRPSHVYGHVPGEFKIGMQSIYLYRYKGQLMKTGKTVAYSCTYTVFDGNQVDSRLDGHGCCQAGSRCLTDVDARGTLEHV